MNTVSIIWATLLIALIMLQVSTNSLVVIYLAIGALAGLILNAMMFDLPNQILIAFTVALTSLSFVLPLNAFHKTKDISQKRNAHNK